MGKRTLTISDIEDIQEKIDQAKERKARKEGEKAKIEEGWKKDFGVESLEHAKAKREEKKKERDKAARTLDDALKELSEMADWDEL